MNGYKFELYKDAAGEHRWRFLAPNGEITSVSSEGYKNRADRDKALENLRWNASEAEIVDSEEKG